ADGALVGFDALQKVSPEAADVLVVRLLQLRVLVEHGLALIAGVEGPAVQPAQMEGAFGAVEVAADVVLLRLVPRVEPVLPDRGERLELEAGDLGIRRVGAVPLDRAVAGREDRFGILLLSPPEDLVQPVDAPVAELAVGVVEVLAEAAGVNVLVERP